MRSQTSLQVRTSSSLGCSSTLDNSQWCPTKNASQSPVRSPTLDDQSKHHSPQSAQITGHAGVHGFTGTTGKTPSSSGPVVGRQSMVPEDWELDWQDQSSSVGAIRSGLMGISSSPARSSPRHQGEGSDSLHRCVQFGLGSPVRLTLDTGTVVSISKIVAHQRSGDAGCHQRCERLPASSEVLGGLLDVRQCSDCGLHQGRGRHTIVRTNADDDTSAQVVQSQGDHVDSHPSARSPQHPGWFPVQSWPDTEHGVDDGHGVSKTRVCQVGWATSRLVCNIRQQMTHQVCIAVSRPQGWVDERHVSALGQREGPSCMLSRHSRWSLKFCRRSLSHQVSGLFWSLHCNRQFHGLRSWWIWQRKIQSCCSSRVKHCWLKASWSAMGWQKRVTTGHQIYTRGNSTGHPEGQGPFQGSCAHDVKVPSWLITPGLWIPLGKIVSFWRSKRWHVFWVRSHYFSTHMMHLLRDGLLPSLIISHHMYVASIALNLPVW